MRSFRLFMGLLPVLIAMLYMMVTLEANAKVAFNKLPKPTVPAWETFGPYGGTIKSIYPTSDPTIFYAYAPPAGLYQSKDVGTTWEYTSLANSDIDIIRVDPQNPTTLYFIGYNDLGYEVPFRSVDDGGTWKEISTGIPQSRFPYRQIFTDFAVDPQNPSILYATISEVSSETNGIYKSFDSGLSWFIYNNNLPSSQGYYNPIALTIDPQDSNTIYLSTRGTIYKSMSAGGQWFQVDNGLPEIIFEHLEIAPSDSQTVYAGGYTHDQNFLYRTENGGMDWQSISLTEIPRSYKFEGVRVDPSDSGRVYIYFTYHDTGILYGAIYSKTDDTPWERIDGSLPSHVTFDVALHPTDGTQVFVATGHGIFHSRNRGSSWEASSTGILNLSVVDLEIDPFQSKTLYATTESGGLFKSEDSGLSWNSLSLVVPYSYDLAPHPTISGTLYVSAYGEGIYKSDDGGNHWQFIEIPDDPYILFVRIEASNPTHIYSASARGIYRSTDEGDTWTYLGGTANADFAIDPFNSNIFITSARDSHYGGTVKRSSDGGTTWENIWQFPCRTIDDYPKPYTYCAEVADIEFDPRTVGIVYAAVVDQFSDDNSGIYKSTDGGITWTIVPTFRALSSFSSGANLRIDPHNSQYLYFADSGMYGYGVGFRQSRDGGISWQAFNSGLNQHAIYTIATDPTMPGKLYLGGYGGVYLQTLWYGTYLPFTHRAPP